MVIRMLRRFLVLMVVFSIATAAPQGAPAEAMTIAALPTDRAAQAASALRPIRSEMTVALQPGTVAAAVSANYAHTCALTTTGGVRCWGNSEYGQLGDGTTTNRTTPVDVAGLRSGVAAVSAGAHGSTCTLTTTGGLKCWGRNAGELGDGTTTDRITPVDVVGLRSGVAALSTDPYHTCALTTTGGVRCWGWNEFGQVGDQTRINRSTPADVVGLSGESSGASCRRECADERDACMNEVEEPGSPPASYCAQQYIAFTRRCPGWWRMFPP